MVDGAYALMGLPLGLLGGILGGHARDLLTPRGLLVLVGFPAIGIACLAVGQHVLHGSRRALWAGLGLAVLHVVAGLALLASVLTTDSGDGAAYAFFGGIMFIGMNGFIVLSAMLALRDSH